MVRRDVDEMRRVGRKGNMRETAIERVARRTMRSKTNRRSSRGGETATTLALSFPLARGVCVWGGGDDGGWLCGRVGEDLSLSPSCSLPLLSRMGWVEVVMEEVRRLRLLLLLSQDAPRVIVLCCSSGSVPRTDGFIDIVLAGMCGHFRNRPTAHLVSKKRRASRRRQFLTAARMKTRESRNRPILSYVPPRIKHVCASTNQHVVAPKPTISEARREG